MGGNRDSPQCRKSVKAFHDQRQARLASGVTGEMSWQGLHERTGREQILQLPCYVAPSRFAGRCELAVKLRSAPMTAMTSSRS